ncbi:hypothetical protein GCM10023183_31500 [Nibribacter koreensis]|uniref:Outer membrane protein beta-barrel domain-containing protein n=2 Tax=Nibribacter koreensis TaxID=1084519 RepID=A0ABP8FWH9_9BACT
MAQQTPGTLQLGLVAGPSHVFFDRDDVPYGNVTISSDIRWSAGLSSKYQLNKFFLKVDLLYENKGYGAHAILPYNGRQTQEEINQKKHFHYLTLPLLLGVDILQSGIFLNAGPYIGRLLSQITFESSSEAEKQTARRNETMGWEKFDYGISGGIGYYKEITPILNVSAEIRHNRGLYDIYNWGNYNPNSTSLLLGLHYTLATK